ncbi:MAG TPA: DUF1269 domain-containing protein [Candidatus Limnocylindrales bacterium]|nr:DUF1269 domain-containing protein [Candidatus Limnocylindrales bacterium]
MSDPKRTRLVFLGFTDQMLARTVWEVIKQGRDAKAITIDDVALVSKAVGGKVTITNDKRNDPGAVRGGAFGGTAGMVLATILGPVGLGAVAAGAAVGAVTAAVKDSGLKNDDIAEVSKLMADGRSGLMIAMPVDAAEGWAAFVELHPEFDASDRQHAVEIVPGRTFEQALDAYRRDEEA